jgi:hypothetical protein
MFRSYDHHQAENILLSMITQLTTDPLFYSIANEVEVEVTLRLIVSQYVLVSATFVGLVTRYYFLSESNFLKFAVLYLYDRRSVGQYVLVSGSCPEPTTRFFFAVWQLRVSWYSAPSLTRGWVCNLLVQLLLGLARAVTLGSKSRKTRDHILLSDLRLPQLGGPDSRIYIPREQGGPVIPPGTAFLVFVYSDRLLYLGWRLLLKTTCRLHY